LFEFGCFFFCFIFITVPRELVKVRVTSLGMSREFIAPGSFSIL